MDKELFTRIRTSLLEKRENLSAWLATTPVRNRQMQLAASPDRLVYAHLETLDDAIARCDAGTFGRCEVCNGDIEPELLEVDYTCCVCLGDLSPDEARNLEAELQLAQRVQQTLLPQQVPEIPGLDVAAYSRPAQIVGGDYFDFFGFRDGKHGLTIADVSGHGISASLQMASVQTLLRTLVPANTSPAEVVRQVQHLYSHNIHFTTFVTLCLMAYEPDGRTLTCCNAGHNPPLLVRRPDDGKEAVHWLRPTGAAVGLLEEAQFEEEAVVLQPGDAVVLYTDGVTEAMNPGQEQYGRQKLATLVSQQRESVAKEVVAAIRQDLQGFVEGQPFSDDVTIVACRVLA